MFVPFIKIWFLKLSVLSFLLTHDSYDSIQHLRAWKLQRPRRTPSMLRQSWDTCTDTCSYRMHIVRTVYPYGVPCTLWQVFVETKRYLRHLETSWQWKCVCPCGSEISQSRWVVIWLQENGLRQKHHVQSLARTRQKYKQICPETTHWFIDHDMLFMENPNLFALTTHHFFSTSCVSTSTNTRTDTSRTWWAHVSMSSASRKMRP